MWQLGELENGKRTNIWKCIYTIADMTSPQVRDDAAPFLVSAIRTLTPRKNIHVVSPIFTTWPSCSKYLFQKPSRLVRLLDCSPVSACSDFCVPLMQMVALNRSLNWTPCAFSTLVECTEPILQLHFCHHSAISACLQGGMVRHMRCQDGLPRKTCGVLAIGFGSSGAVSSMKVLPARECAKPVERSRKGLSLASTADVLCA